MAQVNEKKAVHFGAGAIGRGFLGELYQRSGYEIVFADVMDPLIQSLQSTPKYTVTEIGTEGEKSFDVTSYRAINSKTNEADVIKELSTAGIVTCAVGPNILKFIAPVIAKGIDARPQGSPPIAVVACENAIGATDTLAGFIKDNTPKDRVGTIQERAIFANSAVDRIVPVQDPNAGLDVKIESFFEWVVELTPFPNHQHPDIYGVKWVEDLKPYIERKLFTVNTGHATAAYYGYQRGKKMIHEVLEDKEIHDTVHRVLEETKKLICIKHGISSQEQSEYVEKIITRISSP
jgi:mannitol-1-phosphate 5-dehydrogenase